MAVAEELTVQRRERAEGVAMLILTGSINAKTSAQLEAAIQEVCKAGMWNLVLDLANVTYISSSGAGVLMKAFLEARDNQGKLVLATVPASVANILDLLNLQGIIPVAPDVQTALKVFPKKVRFD